MHTQLFDRNGTPRNANATTGKTNGPAYKYLKSCTRCGGRGSSEAWRFTGLTCYECGGSGGAYMAVTPLYTTEQLASLDERAKRAADKKAVRGAAERAAVEACRAARRDQFLADHAATLVKLDALVASDDALDAADPIRIAKREQNGATPFWSGFRTDIVTRANPLSERQVEVVDTAYAKMLAATAARASAHHIGEVGKRMRGVKAEVVMSKHIATVSRFPPIERYLVKIKTACGADLVWFTGNGVTLGECEIDFTVKEHDAYQGTPQTIVQRVTVRV